jgi:biotin operon repressor
MAVSRSSPYRIVLDAAQRRELVRRAGAYSGPYRNVVRAKAILLAADGVSNAEVAERLGVSRPSVSEWRKRFFDQGLDGLEERPRSGRPGSFSASTDASVGCVTGLVVVGRGRRVRASRARSGLRMSETRTLGG